MNETMLPQVGKVFDSLELYDANYKEWCDETGRFPFIFNKMNGKGRNMIVHHCPQTSDGKRRFYNNVTNAHVVTVKTVLKVDSTGVVSMACKTQKRGPDQSATGLRRVL